MRAFRLIPEHHGKDIATAFSGAGGLAAPGRWHAKGHRVVYAAQSLSLTALERLVHLKRTTDLVPHVFFAIDVPEELVERPQRFPPGWNNPIPDSSVPFGTKWLASGERPAMAVPSVVCPGETNLILNPTHRRFSLKWVKEGPTPFFFDPRLVSPDR